MKFYNIVTPHQQSYIDEIIMSLSSTETDYIMNLYSQISMVEYTNESGNECMYALLDTTLIERLNNLYKKYAIKFEVIDLTKEVIFDNYIKIKYKDSKNRDVKNDIIYLIKEFKSNWVTKDDILDKILEKGIDSLSDTDLEILNS